MLKNAIVGAGAIALMGSIASAAGTDATFDNGVDVKPIIQTINDNNLPKGIPSAEEVASTQKAAKPSKDWTIMVYINGKNNLEQFALKDMNEMEMVGSNDNINVVVELGRIKGYSSADGNWTGSRRYLVQKDTDSSKITSPVLQTIDKADMGDWNHAVEFTSWAKTNYPAKKYMLVIWNHGSGWSKTPAELNPYKGISYDDETNNHITTAQMGQILAKVGGVDVYASDACLMQMAEVAYQIKDNSKVIVQSEETEPGDGYTYNDFLNKLVAKPAATPAELGVMASDAYVDHYANGSEGATQSAVNAKAMDKLAAAAKEWVDLVMAAKETDVIKAAKNCQAYYYSDNKDMYDFMSKVAASTKNDQIKAKSQEIMKLLDGTVVQHNRWTGDSYSGSHGLAVYVPGYYSADYDNLAWSKATGWNTFAKWAATL